MDSTEDVWMFFSELKKKQQQKKLLAAFVMIDG